MEFRKMVTITLCTRQQKRPWCWERLKVGGEGDDRGWDGWMASSIPWTWVWASSGSWWWTGKPRVMQSMESQRVGHDWATELNWNILCLLPQTRDYKLGLMEYYSAIKKNTFESVLMRWMKLEPIIQSEASQKEKHQYSILMHIYGI